MDSKLETVVTIETKTIKQTKRLIAWRFRPGEQIFLLIGGDILAGMIALLISFVVWAQKDYLTFNAQFFAERVPGWFFLLPFAWLVFMVESYDVRRTSRRKETLRSIGLAALLSLIVYLVIFFVSTRPGADPLNSLPRLGIGVFIGAVAIMTLIWRYIYIAVFTAPQFMRRVLVVGAGKAGAALVDVVSKVWPSPFKLVGLIDDDPGKVGMQVSGYTILGSNQQMLQIIHDQEISDIVLSISGEMNGEMFQAVLDAQECGVDVTTMPVIYEELLNRVPIFLLDSDWIVRSFVDQARANGFYEISKRIVDVVGGLVGTVILLLTLPITALAIFLDTGRPIFFLQNRLGKRGQMYRIIKYRTMRQDSEKDGLVRVTTENDDRITRIGKFLRKSHLDELPQFINVLKGEMSLVGPRAERAELVNQLQKMIPFYRARLLVKPGITGWAQVNFGYAASVEDTAIKLEYDLYYIKHRNLILDLVILLRTFSTVVGFRGQ